MFLITSCLVSNTLGQISSELIVLKTVSTIKLSQKFTFPPMDGSVFVDVENSVCTHNTHFGLPCANAVSARALATGLQ